MSENQKHPLFFPVGFSVWFCAASVSFQKLVNPASNFGILQTQKQLAGKFQEVDLVFKANLGASRDLRVGFSSRKAGKPRKDF